MKPEELFDKFWNPKNGFGSEWSFCKQGFLRGFNLGMKEAARQAYEDAARMCETNHILNNLCGPLHTAGWELAIKATAEAIRAKIRE